MQSWMCENLRYYNFDLKKDPLRKNRQKNYIIPHKFHHTLICHGMQATRCCPYNISDIYLDINFLPVKTIVNTTHRKHVYNLEMRQTDTVKK